MSEPKSRPPEQINWRLEGDKERADSLRGIGLQLKGQMQRENTFDYSVFLRRYTGKDGTTCTVVRNCGPTTDIYTITIYCPPQKQVNPNAQPNIPSLQPGQFYYVPGCVARYCFGADDLYNELVPPKGTIPEGTDTTNTGTGIAFVSLSETGLPAPSAAPDGRSVKRARACYLAGVDPDSGFSGARLELSSWHVPVSGEFSISCAVRLRKAVVQDYSYTAKTRQLDCGYTVLNPVKPRLLFSEDGQTWWTHCPGGMAPLVGFRVPSRFSTHWVLFTYPWPSYNDNFAVNADSQIGYREIDTVCDDEPLMESAYDAASPYWDKVTVGTLSTLAGEWVSGWETNAAVENAAPYASYCTFRIAGAHAMGAGTRAVAQHADGTARYATVVSSAYDSGADTTTITLQDYQYKRHMTDALPSVTFGEQPFPVRHPKGYMIGTDMLGLCWYNGNCIAAGKVSDFETGYALPPLVSDPLDIGVWHHVCLTYAEDGKTSLYVTSIKDIVLKLQTAPQTADAFLNADELGLSIPVLVGADDYYIAASASAEPSDYQSQWASSADMDMAYLRFYRRALTAEAAALLALESLRGTFVADDDDAGRLIESGFYSVVV